MSNPILYNMARSLKEFYNYESNMIGLQEKCDVAQKLIRSANTGKRIVVPGYEEDFMFQNDRRKVDFDIDRQVDSNWNWNKLSNKIIHKVDRDQPATAVFTPVQRQVREV